MDEDDFWWYQMDQELMQREEEERIEQCNQALAEWRSENGTNVFEPC